MKSFRRIFLQQRKAVPSVLKNCKNRSILCIIKKGRIANLTQYGTERMLVSKKTLRMLELLKTRLKPGMKALIALHDNPDPDCMAAALCMKKIFEISYGVSSVMACGGILGRTENRAMAELCGITLQSASSVRISDFDFLLTVDSQPGAGNTFVTREAAVDMVLDHHPSQPATRRVPMVDIRTSYGASTTLALEYLLAHRLEPDRREATALFYALKSETQDLGRESCPADRRAYFYLFRRIDFKLLYGIVNAKLSRNYFRTLFKGLENARIHNDVLISSLGELEAPDHVSESADWLLRLKDIKWTLLTGVWRDTAYVSIRTSEREANAGGVVQQLVAGLGSGGGHEMMAGAQIDLKTAALAYEALFEELQQRFLKIMRKRSPGADLLK